VFFKSASSEKGRAEYIIDPPGSKFMLRRLSAKEFETRFHAAWAQAGLKLPERQQDLPEAAIAEGLVDAKQAEWREFFNNLEREQRKAA
jgi:bifunctional DNA-binding transcriptional regulator/antitoxin component of YhaV-PrlF toxin-antitoxin module